MGGGGDYSDYSHFILYTVRLFGLLRWLVGLFGSHYPQNKTTGTLPLIYISIQPQLYIIFCIELGMIKK